MKVKTEQADSFGKKLSECFKQHPQLGAFVILMIVGIFFTCASPVKHGSRVFISGANLASILEQTAGISIAAFGMTLVLLVGGIDISIGSTMALISVVSSRLLENYGISVPLVILISILIGITVGMANGALIIRFQVQPFLVTMGMQTIVRGLCYTISKGESIYLTDRTISDIFVRGKLLGIPISAVWTLLFLILMYLLVSRTRYGRWAQAIGGNETAAANSGVSVHKVKLFAYSVNSVTAAFAGLIALSRLGTGMPSIGVGYEMNAIAAAIIGGTSFSGDGGNMFGTLLGSLVMGTLVNGLTIMGVNSYIQDVVRGIIIIVAVIASNVLVQRRN